MYCITAKACVRAYDIGWCHKLRPSHRAYLLPKNITTAVSAEGKSTKKGDCSEMDFLTSSSVGKRSKLASIVAALSDVIRSQQEKGKAHEPTPTEFFAVILASLSSGKHDDSLADLLKIFDAVAPRASPSIVHSQFKLATGCILQIARVNAEDEKILLLSLTALGSIMKAQEKTDGFWGAVHALQSVNAFLACLDDNRYKIRKVCTVQLVELLNAHRLSGSRAVRSYVGDFCIEILKACTRSDYKRSLYTVLFLESAVAHLTEASIKGIFDAALRLQVCEQPVLTAASFRMIDALYQSPYAPFSAAQCLESIQTLINMKPQTSDMEANTYFCTALASGTICLYKRDTGTAHSVLHEVVLSLVSGCETEFTQIHCAVGTALKRVISSCIEDNLVKQATTALKGENGVNSFASKSAAEVIRKVASAVELLLQLKYQHAWLYIMDVVRSLFERIRGESAKLLLGGIIVKLSDLYQATSTTALQVEAGVHVALSDALGAALRSCGLVHFLAVVPLKESASPLYVGIDTSREWILTILHSNLKHMHCALSDFGGCILPIASSCSQAVSHPKKLALNEQAVQVIRTRLLQLWSLLPELCFLGVTDTAQSFPKLAPILEAAMKDEKYPELLPHIVVALTHIARVARERCPLRPEAPPADSPEVAALKTQAQVFLPAVLSFLEGATVGDSRFQNGVQCIAAWAAVAPPAMISAVCKRLLQLLLSSTTASSASMDSADADAASVWMAVVQVMIPHMPDTMVTLLYRTVRPLLSINESVSMQKRAYAVLDSLLKSHGALLTNMESRLQILSVVSESLLVCNVSARTMRLRCMETLMEGMTDADFNEAARSILGEVLICQKDANKKSREGAMAVLDAMIKRVPSQELLLQLCAGIAGETSVMRSAAITGLCLLFHQKREPALLQYAAGLLPTVCLLLREECPEMTRSVLSFLKVCSAVLPTNGLLESVLPQLVEAFTSGLGPHKGKFASRSRAIMRKLSQRMDGEALKALLPEADQAQLGYIQKQARRAQRKKTSRDAETLSLSQVDRFLGSDSDDSDDEDKDRDRKAAATASSNKASGREDPRLQQRPKATKAADVQDSFSSSLEDLLDDQPSTFLNHAQKSVAAKEKAAIPGGKGKGQSVGGGAVRPDDEDEEYTVTVTADGQVVVKQRADDSAADKAAADSDRLLGPGGRKTARSEAEAGTDGASAQPQKKARVREPGEEYRSKKAGGDVWKRGMLEPHAFIPLDPRMLNKKKEKEAVAHFGILVKNGRKARVSGGVGAAGRNSKGTQASRKKRRSMKEHAADRKK